MTTPTPRPRFMTLAPVLAIAAAASGCIVYEDDGPPPYDDPPPPAQNAAPYVLGADAGCFYDGYYADDIWYFEADANDPDGPLDVVAVYADVYDQRTGEWQDSFELYPTDDPVYWFSDWLGSTTWLDCWYGGYVVDIIAYDSFDAYDIVSVRPWTHADN